MIITSIMGSTYQKFQSSMKQLRLFSLPPFTGLYKIKLWKHGLRIWDKNSNLLPFHYFFFSFILFPSCPFPYLHHIWFTFSFFSPYIPFPHPVLSNFFIFFFPLMPFPWPILSCMMFPQPFFMNPSILS